MFMLRVLIFRIKVCVLSFGGKGSECSPGGGLVSRSGVRVYNGGLVVNGTIFVLALRLGGV